MMTDSKRMAAGPGIPGQQTEGNLIDRFGRRIEYVRLSVTDRCNLRCFYCMPKGFKCFEPPDQRLQFDEIERIIRAFAELGVHRVRLTGGEPLVRRDLPDLSGRLAAIPGIEDLSLSTNATLLGRHAQDLYAAGIRRINVSLDTLDAGRYADITGGGDLHRVLDGLQAARDAGFRPIKINMLALKDTPQEEYLRIVEYCIRHDFTLRFIETMPMGLPGQQDRQQYLSLKRVKRWLQQEYDLVPGLMTGGGPARYFRVSGTGFLMGFITPISQHFCATCNRVRIAVDGTLYLCLGQNDKVELRPLLRAGISLAELKRVISDAVWRKPERHEFERKPGQVVRLMSMTGG